jgi:agmatine/peptidylarginine deiminase
MKSRNTNVVVVLLVAAGLMVAATFGSAQVPDRPMPPRAERSWEEVVVERREAFAAEPWRFTVPKLEDLGTGVIAANEADPIEGVIYNWWCNPFTGPDEADFMWMLAIAVAVQSGAHPHVYLDTWAPYPGDLQAACSGMLQTWMGIPSDWVSWYLDVPSDAFWVRDYGPFFVRDIATSDLTIEDARYYPGRPNDDAMPVDFAARIGVPASDFDLFFEGGNFLPNGGGLCIVSSVVRDANPHVDEETLEEMFHLQLGCEQLVVVEALRDHATGHVDMWMAWADHTTLLVGEYLPRQDAVNRAIIERNVRKSLEGLRDPATGDPITIVRVPMPSNCPIESQPGRRSGFGAPPMAPQACPYVPREERIWRTYLNALILNGTVMVPTYAQDRTYEAEALAIWQSFGFNPLPIDADLVVPLQGAFHCVAKTIDAAP